MGFEPRKECTIRLKTSTQLKAKARNLSAQTGVPPHIIQRNYFLERFLERVSLSNHRESIVIKGGVLVKAILGIDARSTIDLDATMRSRELAASNITEIIADVLNVTVDDGLKMSMSGIEETRVEAEYPGFRISISVELDKLRDTIKIDFTAGDVITPKPVEYWYRLMFEDREIRVLAYNIETILAEKYIAILSLDVSNSRMKDFYDIYMLLSEQREAINPSVFAEAVRNTAGQRQMIRLVSEAESIIDTVSNSPIMLALWKRYKAAYKYTAGIEYADAISSLKTLSEWSQTVSDRE